MSKSGRWIPRRYLLVVGHITPAERYPGRHDDPSNLRTMCVSCNNSQRDLADAEWREARPARGRSVAPVPNGTPVRTTFGTRARV